MKLYYKPGACSLATHIILHETETEFDIDQVNTDLEKTKSGRDYKKINPKGYVPALELNSSEVLTEGASILQYIADQHPKSGLTPTTGTIERARLNEYLSYVGTELHEAFRPLFSGNSNDKDRQNARINVSKKFDYINALLDDNRNYLLGEKFSIADAYLFVVSNWANFAEIDLNKWPKLAAFVSRVAQRPASQLAMKAEGLIS
jgi:glutathione S-transferase